MDSVDPPSEAPELPAVPCPVAPTSATSPPIRPARASWTARRRERHERLGAARRGRNAGRALPARIVGGLVRRQEGLRAALLGKHAALLRELRGSLGNHGGVVVVEIEIGDPRPVESLPLLGAIERVEVVDVDLHGGAHDVGKPRNQGFHQPARIHRGLSPGQRRRFSFGGRSDVAPGRRRRWESLEVATGT